ncbi:MAG: outer membrane protein assembly factor [Sterolibacterium sp.]|nr:outer membrane protein assembly factor [Sterolibacterium sp.]MBP9799484.1 outer membrane protein assembly factor [Sterolibacterium sp.]
MRLSGWCALLLGALLLWPGRGWTGQEGGQEGGQNDEQNGRLPLIELHAPEPVQAMLLQYLERPPRPVTEEERGAVLMRLREEAARLLATEGYFSPQLAWSGKEGNGPDITVTPGPRTQVSQQHIEFTGALAQDIPALQQRREALRAGWKLPPGSAFRSADWETAKAALLASVAETEYAAARITDSQAMVDTQTAQATLTLTIDSGPVYRFGALRVEGLQRYSLEQVRVLLPFQPGERYRRDALLTLQSRLQNTPWFQNVSIEATPADAGTPEEAGITGTSGETGVERRLPVTVLLTEAPSKRFSLGLGYGTNTGARGELGLRHHDLFGRAWDLNSGLRYEEKRQTLFADLMLPPQRPDQRVTLGAKKESSNIEGLLTRRLLLGGNQTQRRGQIETRIGLEWQREERQPLGGVGDVDHALVLDGRWIRRAVDQPFDPRRGNVLEIGLGGATPYLLSSRGFLRSHLRLQQWWPVGERDVFTARGEFGLTKAASRFGIPQDYLFRAGGAQSVRGYAYQSLGVVEGNAIVGGRALLTSSLEYTHWRNEHWGVAFFVDAGDAADQWQALRPAVGSGLGARWKSPAGPLAFDLAHGQRSGRWTVHFSLSAVF